MPFLEGTLYRCRQATVKNVKNSTRTTQLTIVLSSARIRCTRSSLLLACGKFKRSVIMVMDLISRTMSRLVGGIPNRRRVTLAKWRHTPLHCSQNNARARSFCEPHVPHKCENKREMHALANAGLRHGSA